MNVKSANMSAPQTAAYPEPKERLSGYALYALFVLILSNFLNYVDRNVMSIVAESLRKDLALTDSQLGFLLGTAFAVLYGVIGIPMARVSDAMNRKNLMAGAMAFWSLMTAMAGFAINFGTLATARIGVGLGEAAANPCSHSLLSDYFPKRNRAAALGAYLIGTYAGMGCSLYLGGLVLQRWTGACHSLPLDACRLANWQATFLIVGIPGLVVAALVYGLREPARPGVREGASFLPLFCREMSAVIPPFTMIALSRGGGRRMLFANFALIGGVTVGAILLATITGDWLQWCSVATGIYCVGSWTQVLRLRDRPLFALTFGCPIFLSFVAGCSIVGAMNNTVQIWAAPFAMRHFGMSPSDAGLRIGLTFAVAAALGVSLAGMLTDRWKRVDRRAPVWIAMISLIGPMPALWTMLYTTNATVFVIAFFVFGLIGMGWAGAAAALAQDLVLPRMRGSAAAALSLVIILCSLSIGPYTVGKISVITGSLGIGLLSLEVLSPIAVVLFIISARRLKGASEQTRIDRASAFGEPVI